MAAFAPKHSQCCEAAGSIVRPNDRARDPSNGCPISSPKALNFQGLEYEAAEIPERFKVGSLKNTGDWPDRASYGAAIAIALRHTYASNDVGHKADKVPVELSPISDLLNVYFNATGAGLAHASVAKGRLQFPARSVPFDRWDRFKSR